MENLSLHLYQLCYSKSNLCSNLLCIPGSNFVDKAVKWMAMEVSSFLRNTGMSPSTQKPEPQSQTEGLPEASTSSAETGSRNNGTTLSSNSSAKTSRLPSNFQRRTPIPVLGAGKKVRGPGHSSRDALVEGPVGPEKVMFFEDVVISVGIPPRLHSSFIEKSPISSGQNEVAFSISTTKPSPPGNLVGSLEERESFSLGLAVANDHATDVKEMVTSSNLVSNSGLEVFENAADTNLQNVIPHGHRQSSSSKDSPIAAQQDEASSSRSNIDSQTLHDLVDTSGEREVPPSLSHIVPEMVEDLLSTISEKELRAEEVVAIGLEVPEPDVRPNLNPENSEGERVPTSFSKKSPITPKRSRASATAATVGPDSIAHSGTREGSTLDGNRVIQLVEYISDTEILIREVPATGIEELVQVDSDINGHVEEGLYEVKNATEVLESAENSTVLVDDRDFSAQESMKNEDDAVEELASSYSDSQVPEANVDIMPFAMKSSIPSKWNQNSASTAETESESKPDLAPVVDKREALAQEALDTGFKDSDQVVNLDLKSNVSEENLEVKRTGKGSFIKKSPIPSRSRAYSTTANGVPKPDRVQLSEERKLPAREFDGKGREVRKQFVDSEQAHTSKEQDEVRKVRTSQFVKKSPIPPRRTMVSSATADRDGKTAHDPDGRETTAQPALESLKQVENSKPEFQIEEERKDVEKVVNSTFLKRSPISSPSNEASKGSDESKIVEQGSFPKTSPIPISRKQDTTSIVNSVPKSAQDLVTSTEEMVDSRKEGSKQVGSFEFKDRLTAEDQDEKKVRKRFFSKKLVISPQKAQFTVPNTLEVPESIHDLTAPMDEREITTKEMADRRFGLAGPLMSLNGNARVEDGHDEVKKSKKVSPSKKSPTARRRKQLPGSVFDAVPDSEPVQVAPMDEKTSDDRLAELGLESFEQAVRSSTENQAVQPHLERKKGADSKFVKKSPIPQKRKQESASTSDSVPKLADEFIGPTEKNVVQEVASLVSEQAASTEREVSIQEKVDRGLDFLDEKQDEVKTVIRTEVTTEHVETEIVVQSGGTNEDLTNYKLPELKNIAKARGLKGYSKLKKSELLDLLRGGEK